MLSSLAMIIVSISDPSSATSSPALTHPTATPSPTKTYSTSEIEADKRQGCAPSRITGTAMESTGTLRLISKSNSTVRVFQQPYMGFMGTEKF
ncbi:hypothetical protein C8J56DRAFT_1050298 [Mycena floridula]|nr:hypothetical protein C8J56DRAFT_1050298 [Mycena floridula]